MKSEYLAIIISIISLLGSVIGYFEHRRIFLLTVASERAAVVSKSWSLLQKIKSINFISDDQWLYWSPVVSEIVSSIQIINKLSGRFLIIRWFMFQKDIYIIFWEQTPTELRSLIKVYNKSTIENQDKNIEVFQKQMKTIIKTYK
jgi:hypothetical protein